MKCHKILQGTMHRRTYNLASRNLYAICSRCPWHVNFWHSCIDNPFVKMVYVSEKMEYSNHPNWKLVSKNRKQWMKKPFIQVREDYPDGSFKIFFRW